MEDEVGSRTLPGIQLTEAMVEDKSKETDANETFALPGSKLVGAVVGEESTETDEIEQRDLPVREDPPYKYQKFSLDGSPRIYHWPPLF